jgi:hypothetical protein
MQTLIAKTDIPHAINHGEHYYVKTFFESTGTAIVDGDNGKEYKLLRSQYTTVEEQRKAFEDAKIKYLLEDVARAKEAQKAS